MMDNCQDGQKRSILTLLNRSNEMYGTHYSYYNYQYEEMDTVWLMTNFSRTINVTVPTCNKDEFLKQVRSFTVHFCVTVHKLEPMCLAFSPPFY